MNRRIIAEIRAYNNLADLGLNEALFFISNMRQFDNLLFRNRQLILDDNC